MLEVVVAEPQGLVGTRVAGEGIFPSGHGPADAPDQRRAGGKAGQDPERRRPSPHPPQPRPPGLASRVRRQRCEQCPLQGAGGAVAPLGIRIERLLDDADEGRRQIRTPVAEPHRGAIAVLLDQIREGRRLDREAPGRQSVEEDADAIHVRRRTGRLAMELLGRHGDGRPVQMIALRFAGGDVGHGPEVHEHDPAAFLAHDVRRLDVAVQEILGVDGGQRLADVDADRRRLARPERPVPLQVLLERPAADEVGPHAGAPVVRVGAVHDQDVAVAHPGQPARLGQEALAAPVARGARREQLQGDFPLQRRIVRAVHLAESPGADAFEEPERAPGVAGRARGTALRCGRHGALRPGQRLDQAQLLEPRRAVRIAGALHVPGDGRAVGHRRRQSQEDVLAPGDHCGLRACEAAASGSPRNRRISSERLTSARDTTMRAASAEGLPSTSAISAYGRSRSTRSTSACRCASDRVAKALS